MSAPASARGGFSIVELVIALIILTIGMLALAAGSVYTTVEVRSSALRTQRSAAIASVVERLRSRAYDTGAFDTLHAVPASTPDSVGVFAVWYDLAPDQVVNGVTFTRKVTVYTRGPQYRPRAGWTATAVDTFVTVIYRPIE